MNRREILLGLAGAPFWPTGADAAPSPTSHVAELITALAAETRRLYHDPALGEAIADRLMTALRSGRFTASSPMELANAINGEIAAASNDIHFMVMPGSMGAPRVPPTPPHQPTPPLTAAELSFLQSVDFGIASIEILPGLIGKLALHQFYRPAAEVGARIAAAMSELADSSAMIIDLTNNVGGDPHSVALLLSYFFDRPPFVVNRFHWRGRPVEEFRTHAAPGGPRYGESRPLIVLVGASTFSAAEEFAYDVQALRRGTVIGGRTGGGANHALPVSLAGGFTAFLPQARAENPVTRTNWERRGVQPDHPTPPAQTSSAGYRFALEQVIATGEPRRAQEARDALAQSGG